MALIQQIFIEYFDVRIPRVDTGDTEQTSPKSLLLRSLCFLGAELCNAALLMKCFSWAHLAKEHEKFA